MSKLTEEQRERLGKLATYLEGLSLSYKHFDMDDYVYGLDSHAKARYALKNGGLATYNCGAVACALGHGPAAGILVPRSLVHDHRLEGKWIDWHSYSHLFIGEDKLLWSWLFDADWAEVDNGHRGAAARIRYILAGNDIPDGYEQTPRRKYRALYAPYRVSASAKVKDHA